MANTAAPATSSAVPKEVLAFYYGWYGNPNTNGSWVHWQPQPGSTTQASNITDIPTDGLYSSMNPAEVATQIAEAQSAGITGLVASWWGRSDYTNRQLPLLLNAADNTGMKITAMLDTGSITGTTSSQLMVSAEQDLEYLVQTYASNPAWLTVYGKPVIFIYGPAANKLTPAEWTTVLQVANASIPNGIIAMGPDGAAPNGASWEPVFNGGFNYSTAGNIKGMSTAQATAWTAGYDQRQVQQDSSAGEITANTVIPGFNNSNDTSGTPIVDARDNGALYAGEWQSALDADPDWVLITSWNEYHEGTEIEPTVQYGRSYLTATATYADRFLGMRNSGDNGPATAQITPLNVYRFLSTTTGEHFYTASTEEMNTVRATRPDLLYEGVGMEAANPASDPNAAPVYRFLDTTDGSHFFTASASERDTVTATRPDLQYEGIGFYEHLTQEAGDTPVYRFLDMENGSHFYTASGSELASVLATRPDMHYEGTAFYAHRLV